jgi:hypothetical protein
MVVQHWALYFEKDKFVNEFDVLDARLREIVLWTTGYTSGKWEIPLRVTSIYREGNGSVHGHWRGLDAGSREFSTWAQGEILEVVNKRYPYGDEEHKTLIWHDVGQGEHFHFQVKGL